MNLLDIYRDDISGNGKVISVSGGREWRGPCPVCGGTDRFGVWPDQGDGYGSFFCGRQKGGGHGCGIGGDAIQYLRDVRKYTYHEACDCLGITPHRGGESLQYKVPSPPKKRQEAIFEPKEAIYPAEVADPAVWREHGMKFVEKCHKALLARPLSIAYLMARGIDRDQICKYRLGFHHGETRGDMKYEPSFRPWPSWGLKPETKQGGKYRMLILPAGLVIPYIVDGLLHRLTIRLIKKDPKAPKKKYHYVRGSIRDLWISNPTAEAFVLQEAELDCIAVDGAAGDLVGTVGLGSTGTKPDARAAEILRDKLIIDSLDFDEPVLNPKTGKIERPGAAGGKWWREQYSKYKRRPVPIGKDAGEAFAEGVDLRTWVQHGLSSPTHIMTVLPSPVPEINKALQKIEQPQQQRIELLLKQKKIPQTEEVQELKKLLTQAEGFIRVYGRGTGIGPVISPEWSAKNDKNRSRISWLLYNSDSVSKVISTFSDGLYGPDHFMV